jgi:hypothetical protein
MNVRPGMGEGHDRLFNPDDMRIECAVGCLVDPEVSIFEKCSKSRLPAGLFREASQKLLNFLLHWGCLPKMNQRY